LGLLARARGFDCGVERKQISLERNAVDEGRDVGDLSVMPLMVEITWLITAPPWTAVFEACSASALACTAFSAFCLTVFANSSTLLDVSSWHEACSSVRCDRSLLPIAISRAAVLME
jgi:hypothetical protein